MAAIRKVRGVYEMRVPASKVVSEFVVRARVTGKRTAMFRLRVSIGLLKLAALIGGFSIEIESPASTAGC